jgi:hypothetical protein
VIAYSPPLQATSRDFQDDMDDEYTMAESTFLECVNEFTRTIVDLY